MHSINQVGSNPVRNDQTFDLAPAEVPIMVTSTVSTSIPAVSPDPGNQNALVPPDDKTMSNSSMLADQSVRQFGYIDVEHADFSMRTKWSC